MKKQGFFTSRFPESVLVGCKARKRRKIPFHFGAVLLSPFFGGRLNRKRGVMRKRGTGNRMNAGGTADLFALRDPNDHAGRFILRKLNVENGG